METTTQLSLLDTNIVRTAEVISVQTINAGQLGKLELIIWKVSNKIHKNRYFYTLEGALSNENTESIQFFINHPEYGPEDVMQRYYIDTLKGVTDDKIPSTLLAARVLQKNFERLATGKGCDYDRVAKTLKWFKNVYQLEPNN